jgi:cyanophycin synthetase
MQITDSSYCYNPNIFAEKAVFWLQLHLGSLGKINTAGLGSSFARGLLTLLPGLMKHDLEAGIPFSSLLPQGQGLHLGRVVERIALELQRLTGNEVSWGTTIVKDTPEICLVVVECFDKALFPLVAQSSLFILNQLLPEPLRDKMEIPHNFDLRRRLQMILQSLQAAGLDQSTKALVQKAQSRGIPWLRLSPTSCFVQLGSGCFARRIIETSTCLDDPIGERIAKNKHVTLQLLSEAGFLVPKQFVALSVQQAIQAARSIGYPVVVKPSHSGKGQGITTAIRFDAGVARAIEIAFKYGATAVIEQHVEGDDHRLLVVGGKLVAAAKRIPAHVKGDGVHSVAELIQLSNRDPRRGIGFQNLLVQLELNDRTLFLLKRAGYSPETIPRKDQIIALSDTANISTGGTALDVTAQVHQDNQYIAESVALHLGLAVCGVDMITPDISRSWREIPGYIIEVNHSPGMQPHWLTNPNQDVVGPILDMLFPAEKPVQMPIAAVTGSNGKTTTCSMLAHILRTAGMKCGLATTQGVFIDGHQTLYGDCAGANGARSIMLQKQLEVAVLESSRRGLLRNGLSCNFCDVGAVLNITSEHVGNDGIESIEELARIKRLVVESARRAVILNADDTHCLDMVAFSRAQRLCLVSTHSENNTVKAHVAQGGHAVVLSHENGLAHIVFMAGSRTISLLATNDIPATYGNRASCNISNAMFAAALAWEMDVPVDKIINGLHSFHTTFAMNPGRLNLYEGLPFKVVLDFAHNPAKFDALKQFIIKLPCKGRRIGVITSPGNRVDGHFQDIARVCAGVFTHYLLARWDDPRGRKEREVQTIMYHALLESGVNPANITICNTETEATERALSLAGKDDTVVLAVQNHSRCWQRILALRASMSGDM